MKFWHVVLRLSPAIILLCGLALALIDGITLAAMPEPMREILPAHGAFILLPAIVKALFSVVGAAAAYWLLRLVETLVPGVRT